MDKFIFTFKKLLNSLRHVWRSYFEFYLDLVQKKFDPNCCKSVHNFKFMIQWVETKEEEEQDLQGRSPKKIRHWKKRPEKVRPKIRYSKNRVKKGGYWKKLFQKK